MLLTMLAALAPNVAHANSTLAAEQTSCAIPDMLRSINVHDTNGSVTFNIYCVASQLPPSNTQLNGHIIAVVVITTLLAYQLLCAASRWSSDHTSTLTHVQRDIPAGCNGAVSEAPRARKISLPEQQALLFDKELASKSATPREPLFPVESARPNPQTFSTVWVKSDPSHDVARSYAPRANHQHAHESAISATSDTQRTLSPGNDYHRPPQISAGDTPAPRNIETTPGNGDRTPPLRQASTSYSVPGTDPSLLKSFNGSAAPYIISSFVVLAVGSDWTGTKWHLPGVAFDLGWLGRIFSVVGSIFTLHTFPAGTPVTLEQVHSKVLEMFEKAPPGAAIVLYFTGHGHGDSYFLNNSEIIDSKIIIEWIAAIRKKKPSSRPVFIVFDHCRFESLVQPEIDLGENIYILWSCQPGQRSADFRMSGKDGADIPRSNLLKAFCFLVDELLVDGVLTLSTGDIDCLMSRLNGCMHPVVRMMRADECRKRMCLRPCAVCACRTRGLCNNHVTRSKHLDVESYPRVQTPGGQFSGYKTGVRISELILRIGTAANPVLKEMQVTARRIKMHKTYRMVDDQGRFTLSTLWMIRLSILVSIPSLILASVLSFFAPTEPESAAGSVPAAAGLPGETNLFQPAGLLVGRGAMATTAECLAPPLPV